MATTPITSFAIDSPDPATDLADIPHTREYSEERSRPRAPTGETSMGLPVALLKVIGKGVLNAVGGGIVGDVLFDALPEVAREVYGWWRKDRTPAQQREEVQALVQARPAEVRAAAHEVVLEL